MHNGKKFTGLNGKKCISQIVQKTENLLFSVKISFSFLNTNNCPFHLQFKMNELLIKLLNYVMNIMAEC